MVFNTLDFLKMGDFLSSLYVRDKDISGTFPHLLRELDTPVTGAIVVVVVVQ